MHQVQWCISGVGKSVALWQNQVIQKGSWKNCEESRGSESRTYKQKEPLGKQRPGCELLWRLVKVFEGCPVTSGGLLKNFKQRSGMLWSEVHFYFIFWRFYLFTFRERGSEGEKHQYVRNISIGFLSHAPNRTPGLQPWHVPLLGIELAAFWFSGWHSIHWATPTRARSAF